MNAIINDVPTVEANINLYVEWANVPDDYNYVGFDDDGHVYAYINEPILDNHDGMECWLAKEGTDSYVEVEHNYRFSKLGLLSRGKQHNAAVSSDKATLTEQIAAVIERHNEIVGSKLHMIAIRYDNEGGVSDVSLSVATPSSFRPDVNAHRRKTDLVSNEHMRAVR